MNRWMEPCFCSLILCAAFCFASLASATPPPNQNAASAGTDGRANGVEESVHNEVAKELPKAKLPAIEKGDASARIKNALEGSEVSPTGDGMLDDVLDVIRKRGSVLDGSVLDSELPSVLPATGKGESEEQEDSESDADHTRASSELFELAEQLLRTARRLEKVGMSAALKRQSQGPRGAHAVPSELMSIDQMVYQMRLRAVELMRRGLKVSVE
ncbi:hypothetical protein LOC71_04495 [Rhodopirellula sp. JC740]|uniref:Secreted protein n=1 Tax=Rhodopirellula halodulae TaxID=2894198 RepID=A0ABS8ND89_9BACT|nr:hypothetical protein [Rhodopirellula sp. JC740]MCC9641521.1 hypothetical protein [Rhodopirellula sp. JC740]